MTLSRRERRSLALAFLKALGPGEAVKGLELLKALAPGIRKLPGAAFGGRAAEELGDLVLKAGGEAGCLDRELSLTARFCRLLAQKGLLFRLDEIIREVETRLEENRALVRVRLEAAYEPEEDFLRSLAGRVQKRTAAGDVKIETTLVPGLLGGYRLHLGSDLIDGSLASALKNLGETLAGEGEPKAAGEPGGC
ncbi:MAG: F0F1 ATP synthase subunit delta [Spirochaetales bacterium]|jgi:F0F1-type ATP synthase delta subunit|nr:F0F1 ATP synthase subunit delta [Spirochaetales bacterium]